MSVSLIVLVEARARININVSIINRCFYKQAAAKENLRIGKVETFIAFWLDVWLRFERVGEDDEKLVRERRIALRDVEELIVLDRAFAGQRHVVGLVRP